MLLFSTLSITIIDWLRDFLNYVLFTMSLYIVMGRLKVCSGLYGFVILFCLVCFGYYY